MSIEDSYPVYRTSAVAGIELSRMVKREPVKGSYLTNYPESAGKEGKIDQKRSFARLSQSDRLFQRE